MFNTKKVIPLSLGLVLSSISVSYAATVDLTTTGWVQYGDAQSYSLPIAQYGLDKSLNLNPGDAYYVKSAPGDLHDTVNIATGTNNGPVVNNASGMDNAYSTPTGTGGATYFSPTAVNANGTTGSVANNGANTWDSNLLAMKNYLNGEQMAVFFNNNQMNSCGTACESLAAWAKVWITDASGALYGSVFEFVNRSSANPTTPGKYDLVSQGGGGLFLGDVSGFTSTKTTSSNPVSGTVASTDFVLSGGSICVLPNAAPGGGPLPVSCSTPGAVGPFNHNLGANNAAYALVFPELNSLMGSLFSTTADNALDDYTMHVDVRLGCVDPASTSDPQNLGFMSCLGSTAPWGNGLNNGYEQIFIATAVLPGTTVPEPGSLALIGLALTAFGLGLRRRTN